MRSLARSRALLTRLEASVALATTSSLLLERIRVAVVVGYSSSAKWKLEPPKPKEETDARLGWLPSRTQGRRVVLI